MGNNRGFTLVEMMICVIIIGIIITITVSGFKNFGAHINTRRIAEEVALSLRETQAYAFAIKGFDPDGAGPSGLVFTSWGVNFDKSISDKQYNIFVDLNNNKAYDPAASPSELIRTVTLGSGIKIANLAKGLRTAEADSSAVTKLDAIYQRPNPDTTLKADGTTCSGLVSPGTCPDLEVILTGPSGGQRTVVIWSTGQVSIE